LVPVGPAEAGRVENSHRMPIAAMKTVIAATTNHAQSCHSAGRSMSSQSMACLATAAKGKVNDQNPVENVSWR
jgi:hypothetical protein